MKRLVWSLAIIGVLALGSGGAVIYAYHGHHAPHTQSAEAGGGM